VAHTDSFYNAWLQYHFSRTDIDSMKSWGFNAVRVAMHYIWFTPPVEEEAVPGEITWTDTGFTLIDSLLDWCADNEMYLILDLHGTPGGQGTDAAISDYDPAKPSLWESQANKDKTIALWRKLAERYSDEPWIGGYDLINEPNWQFSEAGNAPLWQLYQNITEAIRQVDQNHMIIVEGNWFANDYSGVPSPWDDNLVFSFHKYWTFNTQGSIQYAIDLRNTHNVPIWLGETGENSNTWFTNLIALCEQYKIGWSWWPVKKAGINNVLRVETNDEYTALLNYWKGEGPALTESEAFAAVLGFAERHKIENCIWQKDVTDAMIRQPSDYATLPYKAHQPGNPVYCVDYDLGRNNSAYFDTDTANYHLDQDGTYTNWNQGHAYRNDGVDIEACSDIVTNGYNAGWTSDGEWMTYSFASDSAAAYTLSIRHASGGTGGIVRILTDGIPLTGNISLPGTGGWQNWNSAEIEDVVLSGGMQKLKLEIVQGGSNLNYFLFSDPAPVSETSFQAISAETDEAGSRIFLYLNLDIDTEAESIPLTDFLVTGDGNELDIDSFSVADHSGRTLIVHLSGPVYYGSELHLSYSGSSLESGTQLLGNINNLTVENKLPVRFPIPGRIEAEDYYLNQGLELEICEDAGGGYNTGYTNAGDFLDYNIHVAQAGTYSIHFRVATEQTNAQIVLLIGEGDSFTAIDTVSFTSTTGWQNWTTQSSLVILPEGRYTFRILIKQSEHNLNWFEFSNYTAIDQTRSRSGLRIYPNPAGNVVHISDIENGDEAYTLYIFNSAGRLINLSESDPGQVTRIDTSYWDPGLYFVNMVALNHRSYTGQFILVK
jgi:hypothetical protein